MPEKNLTQKTVSSVKWSAIEKFGLQGMRFVLGLIMARLLLPSDYGTVGLISIFIAISTTFVDSGFGRALIRKLDRTETDFSTVFYFNIIVACVCYGILFLIAPWIAEFFKVPILTSIVRVQSITLIISALMQIHVSKLTIELNFKALAIRSILATLLSGICGIIMAYNGFGVWALVYQTILQHVINLVFIYIYCRWRPSLVFSWKSFKELGSFGSKLLASSLLHTIYMQMNTLVIGRFFSAKDIGFYNRGAQFAHLPVDTMNSVLGKVAFPIFVNLQNDDTRLINAYRKYVRALSIPVSFGCILLAALAKPLILLLLTNRWADSILYLQIIALAVVFDPICSVNLVLLQVKGRSDLYLRLEIIKKTVSMAILFAAIPFGVVGICVSKIIYTQFAVIVNTYYTGKFFNLGYFAQVKDFSKYLLIAVFACLPAFGLANVPLTEWLSIPENAAYFVSLAVGCISATGLYYLFLRKDESFQYFLKIFENKFPFLKKVFR